VREYLKEKRRELRNVRPIEMDAAKWSANAYFVNSGKRDDVWGTHSLSEFYDMYAFTLTQHLVKDCIFFLNKREFPLLRKDLCEPYFFLWGGDAAPPRKWIRNEFTSRAASHLLYRRTATQRTWTYRFL